jgi:hypothetical protein
MMSVNHGSRMLRAVGSTGSAALAPLEAGFADLADAGFADLADAGFADAGFVEATAFGFLLSAMLLHRRPHKKK